MDWKWLVQFALLGSGGLEQYAILLVRVSIGVFFAISGANKLFVAGGTKPVYDTLVQSKVPFPPPDGLFRLGCRARLRIPGGCGVSFEPGRRGFIDRYDCRHPDQRDFHVAQRTFAS
jgi:hypothetical protein